ncbi:MAG: hypothetical protein SVP52_07565, partial [Chloroflexota bacterium]|nr:hypothetical protein [Chloroflexota bacterium]
DHDTASKRKTLASHKMTVTFPLKPFLKPDEALFLVMSCEGGATSAFSLYGAQANYELRL